MSWTAFHQLSSEHLVSFLTTFTSLTFLLTLLVDSSLTRMWDGSMWCQTKILNSLKHASGRLQTRPWINFINCITSQTIELLRSLYPLSLQACCITTHRLTNICMCKHALTRVPLISPRVTLTLAFWVSDKAVLVLNCFSPTKTCAKQSTELTSEPAGRFKIPTMCSYLLWSHQNWECCLKYRS